MLCRTRVVFELYKYFSCNAICIHDVENPTLKNIKSKDNKILCVKIIFFIASDSMYNNLKSNTFYAHCCSSFLCRFSKFKPDLAWRLLSIFKRISMVVKRFSIEHLQSSRRFKFISCCFVLAYRIHWPCSWTSMFNISKLAQENKTLVMKNIKN